MILKLRFKIIVLMYRFDLFPFISQTTFSISKMAKMILVLPKLISLLLPKQLSLFQLWEAKVVALILLCTQNYFSNSTNIAILTFIYCSPYSYRSPNFAKAKIVTFNLFDFFLYRFFIGSKLLYYIYCSLYSYRSSN